jgi:hypothetical protein
MIEALGVLQHHMLDHHECFGDVVLCIFLDEYQSDDHDATHHDHPLPTHQHSAVPSMVAVASPNQPLSMLAAYKLETTQRDVFRTMEVPTRSFGSVFHPPRD